MGWFFTSAAAKEEDISHSTGLPSRYLRTIFRGHMEPSVNWAQKVSLGDDADSDDVDTGGVGFNGENVVGIMDGGFKHVLVIFPEILGMSSSHLTFTHIFQRGGPTTNQKMLDWIYTEDGEHKKPGILRSFIQIELIE